MYYFKNKRYYNAIKDYMNGDENSCLIILKGLSKINRKDVKFDEEINAFITEVQSVAKKKKDNQMIAYTQQIGNLMKKNDGNTLGYNAALENTILTDHECVIVIENAMKYGEYQVAINNIVEYIAKTESFYAAYLVLKKMDECTVVSPAFDKETAVMLFIEKMFVILTENDVVYCEGGLFSKCYKSYWKGFKEKDFIQYQEIVKKYTDRYSVKEILSLSGEMQYRKSFPMVLLFKYKTYEIARITIFSIEIENGVYVIDCDYQRCYEKYTYKSYWYSQAEPRFIHEEASVNNQEILWSGRNEIEIKIPRFSGIEFKLELYDEKHKDNVVLKQRINVKTIKQRGKVLVVASKE